VQSRHHAQAAAARARLAFHQRGSEYWPKTGDGRVLCLALAMYGFAIFGYVTAALATYFIGRDRAEAQ
jgi:hypothetical protein